LCPVPKQPHERDHRRPAIDDLHRRSSGDGENPCGRSCEPSTSSYRRDGYPLRIIDRQPRRGWHEWRLAPAHQWILYSSPRWKGFVAGDGNYLNRRTNTQSRCLPLAHRFQNRKLYPTPHSVFRRLRTAIGKKTLVQGMFCRREELFMNETAITINFKLRKYIYQTVTVVHLPPYHQPF